jgi:hypothetical protein
MGDATITFGGGNIGNNTTYTAFTGCPRPADPDNATDDAGNTLTFAITEACLGSDGAFAVIGVATDDDADDAVIGIASVVDVQAVAGGAAEATLGTWNETPDTWDLTFDNLPADFVGLGASMGEVIDETSFTRGLLSFVGATATSPSAVGSADFLEYSMSVRYDIVTIGGRDIVADGAVVPGTGAFVRNRLANDTTAETVDVTAAVPHVDSIELDGADLSRPAVTWSADGANPALSSVELTIVHLDGNMAAGSWLLIGDPTQGTFQTPELPAELADRWGTPANADALQAVVQLREHSEFATYDAVRTGPLLSVGLEPLGNTAGAVRSFTISASFPTASAAAGPGWLEIPENRARLQLLNP